ncbi:MAG: hypothetical protein DME23_14595 [Verrucomicrobia bacterium]|nr:MAG: hypothetical protein DME23_14595 [Verrucomicrobiota bacterium]
MNPVLLTPLFSYVSCAAMLNENTLPHSRLHVLVARSPVAPAGLAAALLLCAIGSLPASANDWPRWRGTDFNGISKETGWSASWPQEGPKQLWKANVGTGFSSIAVSNGRAYTLGNINDTETIYCLDANTGKVLWKHSYACSTDPNLYEGGPNATPTVDGNAVYTFSRKGHVFALDARSGNVAGAFPARRSWMENCSSSMPVPRARHWTKPRAKWFGPPAKNPPATPRRFRSTPGQRAPCCSFPSKRFRQ